MSATLARARVLRLIGRRALIESVDQGCGRCHEPGGCGGYRALSSGRRQIEVDNPVGAAVGDIVEVEVTEGAVARLAGSFYLLPLAGIVVGAALGGDGLPAIASAVAGGLLGFGAARYTVRRENQGAPTVVRICGKHQEK